MKFVLVLAAVVALVAAAPLDAGKNAQILRSQSDNIGIDGYNFAFESSDGTTRQEVAQLKNVGTNLEALSVQGQFSYVGSDGQPYSVNYLADENGFQAQGAHLPTNK